jgi:glycosyltransferase involved in cell wall biosynthesis
MRSCLWLARAMPFPLTAGDRIYTTKLATALAAADVAITFCGLAADVPPEPVRNITWRIIAGQPLSQLRALMSMLPLVGARFATRAYRRAVAELAVSRPWDVVVIDQYGMGWVLALRRLFADRPVFVFLTHDHEETVTQRQYRDPAIGIVKRLYLAQNYLKTRRLERATARGCDLLTTITAEDAALFARQAPRVPSVVLLPGYDGPRMAARRIDAAVPRAAVSFGSYRWSAKQANLKLFMAEAGRRIVDAGIALNIVGDMADDFRAQMRSRHPQAVFTGFVADPAPYLDARLAIVAEPIGGGFKLKLLEYVFRRLPILALESCVAGFPAAIRRHMLIYPDLAALAQGVVAVIDDTAMLDRLQAGAFHEAEHLFAWSDRGTALNSAIDAAKPRQSVAPAAGDVPYPGLGNGTAPAGP